jgi:hypothetical protein
MMYQKVWMHTVRSYLQLFLLSVEYTNDQCPDHSLDIVLHMALLSATEKAACETVDTTVKEFHYVREDERGLFLRWRGGGDIDHFVWESEWSEGEKRSVG